MRFRLLQIVVAVAFMAAFAGAQTQPASQPATRRSDLPTGAKVIRDLDYATLAAGTQPAATSPAPKLLLDLYLPEKHTGKLPLIIWIHGGSWIEGSKKYCQGSFLASHGYAVASINYRLSTEAAFPAQIFDCKAAVRWLRANAEKYDIDPDRFGAYGESAGGHLAALLGVSNNEKTLEGTVGDHVGVSSAVQAVCERHGNSDFTQKDAILANAKDEKTRLFMLMVIQKFLGVSVRDPGFAERAKAASPLFYVTKNAPPFFILHGDKDVLVPLDQSRILQQALKKSGVEATLQVVENAGHGFRPTAEHHRQIREFFDKHLKAGN